MASMNLFRLWWKQNMSCFKETRCQLPSSRSSPVSSERARRARWFSRSWTSQTPTWLTSLCSRSPKWPSSWRRSTSTTATSGRRGWRCWSSATTSLKAASWRRWTSGCVNWLTRVCGFSRRLSPISSQWSYPATHSEAARDWKLSLKVLTPQKVNLSHVTCQ